MLIHSDTPMTDEQRAALVAAAEDITVEPGGGFTLGVRCADDTIIMAHVKGLDDCTIIHDIEVIPLQVC